MSISTLPIELKCSVLDYVPAGELYYTHYIRSLYTPPAEHVGHLKTASETARGYYAKNFRLARNIFVLQYLWNKLYTIWPKNAEGFDALHMSPLAHEHCHMLPTDAQEFCKRASHYVHRHTPIYNTTPVSLKTGLETRRKVNNETLLMTIKNDEYMTEIRYTICAIRFILYLYSFFADEKQLSICNSVHGLIRVWGCTRNISKITDRYAIIYDILWTDITTNMYCKEVWFKEKYDMSFLSTSDYLYIITALNARANFKTIYVYTFMDFATTIPSWGHILPRIIHLPIYVWYMVESKERDARDKIYEERRQMFKDTKWLYNAEIDKFRSPVDRSNMPKQWLD